MVVYY